MKQLTVLFFLILVVLASCTNRKKIPSGIIRQEMMGEILWDMALAEEYTINYLIKDTLVTKEEKVTAEFEKILAIHSVSQEKFRKSLGFYKSRPDLMKVMMDTLHNRSQRNREQIYMQNKVPEKIKKPVKQ
jgi:hypothetical protein